MIYFIFTYILINIGNVSSLQSPSKTVELLSTGKDKPATIVEKMVEAVHTFVGEAEQSDDLTMLAIKFVKSNGK